MNWRGATSHWLIEPGAVDAGNYQDRLGAAVVLPSIKIPRHDLRMGLLHIFLKNLCGIVGPMSLSVCLKARYVIILVYLID